MVFLNLINQPQLISAIVDINPVKQGCFVAGTGHEIISIQKLKELKPDYLFIANKNYKNEIKSILDDNNILCELAII